MIFDEEMAQLKKELERGLRFTLPGMEHVMEPENTDRIMKGPKKLTEFHLTIIHEDDENEGLVIFNDESALRKKIGELLSDGYRLEELHLHVWRGSIVYTDDYDADITQFL